jgi:uncharacterized protein
VGRDGHDTWTTDALKRGDIEAIKTRAVDDPGYLSSREFLNDTPLLSAVAFASADLVKFLLDRGGDPNVDRGEGYSCLDCAVESTNRDSAAVLSLLLDAGADVCRGNAEGRTALHLAAMRGYLDKVTLLVQAGADVNAQTCDGETPLMDAAQCGRSAVVKFLLDRGADATVRNKISGHNALESAREAAKGADPNVSRVLGDMELKTSLEDVERLAGVTLDLSDDERSHFDSLLKTFDTAKCLEVYRQCADRIAKEGDHAGVIRLLENS